MLHCFRLLFAAAVVRGLLCCCCAPHLGVVVFRSKNRTSWTDDSEAGSKWIADLTVVETCGGKNQTQRICEVEMELQAGAVPSIMQPGGSVSLAHDLSTLLFDEPIGLLAPAEVSSAEATPVLNADSRESVARIFKAAFGDTSSHKFPFGKFPGETPRVCVSKRALESKN